MQNDPNTHLFLSFRSQGDTEALATLFDRTAPQLLILAMHWIGDAGVAEDLVQQTFLQAMQHADRFDADRPILPWLAGICANLARREWRHKQRTGKAVPLDESRDVLEGVDRDPAAQVEDADALAQVTKALDLVPAAYRDALVLNLVHGLRAVDIAHSLGRTPSTVRSQLKRGAEHLRRLLPKSLAAPVIAVLCHERGLSQVRAHVLQAASAETTATVAAGLLHSGLGRLGLAVALLIGALVVAWQFGLVGSGPVPTVAEISAAGAPTVAPPTVTTNESAPAEATVPGLRRAAAPTPPHGIVVTGRCVARESQAPLPGCKVSALPTEEANLPTGPGQARWFGTSDAQGRFRVELSELPPNGVALRYTAPGRADMLTDRVLVQRGKPADVGTIEMPIGIRVRGRVTDTDKFPVVHYHVYLKRKGLQRGRPARPIGPVGLTTYSKADGSFEIPHLLAAGDYRIRSMPFDRTPVKPVRLALAEPTAPTTKILDIQVPALRADQMITGRAMRPDGKPWALTYVYARSSSADTASARTTPDGYFTLLRMGSNKSETVEIRTLDLFQLVDGVRVPVVHPDALTIVGGPIATQWGARDLRVVMRRVNPKPTPARLSIKVVRADNGAPVADFGIRFYTARGSYSYAGHQPTYLDKRVLHRGSHADGVLELPGVLSMQHHLAIYPGDPKLQATDLVTMMPPKNGRYIVKLQPKARLIVEVVAADKSPRQGTRVQLIRAENPAKFEFRTNAFAAATSFAPGAQVVSEARTDARGRVELPAGARQTPYVLRIFGAGHRDRLLRDVRLPRSAPLRVVVESGATLAGTIGPASALAELSQVPGAQNRPVVRVTEGDRKIVWPLGPRAAGALSAAGEFHLDGIPPGRWQISISYRDPRMSWRSKELPAIYTLAEGQRHTVRVDLAVMEPGTLRGVVLWNGKPYADKMIALVRTTPTKATRLEVQTDQNGAIPDLQMLPGRYRVDEVPEVFGTAPHRSENDLEVLPGRTVSTTFELWTAVAEVRLLKPDGKTPVVDAACWVGAKVPAMIGKPMSGTRMHWGIRSTRSDASGSLRLERLPKKFYLRVVDTNKRQHIAGPFTRPAGKASFALHVTLKEN